MSRVPGDMATVLRQWAGAIVEEHTASPPQQQAPPPPLMFSHAPPAPPAPPAPATHPSLGKDRTHG